VVVNAVFGNDVDLRMLGGKFRVEGVHCRMWLNTADVALAKTNVQSARLLIGETLMRKPDSEIAAHRLSFIWRLENA
jgi:hypothetical protein